MVGQVANRFIDPLVLIVSNIMPSTTLIIGGCRSGKSSHALDLAEQINGSRKLFVATCIPQDSEMAARVKHHQRERGAHWRTVESPYDLAKTIVEHGPGTDVMLIDCLTLWISNLMGQNDDTAVLHHVEQFVDAARNAPCPIIAVSNEVGTGIVPENEIARRFRDLAGWCNQSVAAACQCVSWMVAGIAVPVKKAA